MAEVSDVTFEQSIDENEQETVTLGEVLQSEEQLMEDVNAVLGAIDDKKCSYMEGYMKRQALYSCLTCIPEARTNIEKCAGICLACCYNCHEGHELIELYTKRNFRCDCGNSKFPVRNCCLHNTKDELNPLNHYNQNFTGLYCTCKRPYPDPEDTVTDEMIQCIICEDWFHTRHLGVPIPPQNVFAEMCCEECIKVHQFLLHYEGLSTATIETVENKGMEVTDTLDEATNIVNVEHDSNEKILIENVTENQQPLLENVENSNENQPDLLENTENATGDEQNASETTPASAENGDSVNENEPTLIESGECAMETEQDDHPSTNGHDSAENIEISPTPEKPICQKPKTKSNVISSKFWTDIDWRSQLCTCPECLRMYEEEKVLFLIDPEDTVHVYEEKGKQRAREYQSKQDEAGIEYLNSLDRVPLMEAIAGYNDMKNNLREYLKKFAENKKVVREEDIKEFFSKFDTKKRARTEIPHFCR